MVNSFKLNGTTNSKTFSGGIKGHFSRLKLRSSEHWTIFFLKLFETCFSSQSLHQKFRVGGISNELKNPRLMTYILQVRRYSFIHFDKISSMENLRFALILKSNSKGLFSKHYIQSYWHEKNIFVWQNFRWYRRQWIETTGGSHNPFQKYQLFAGCSFWLS